MSIFLSIEKKLRYNLRFFRAIIEYNFVTFLEGYFIRLTTKFFLCKIIY